MLFALELVGGRSYEAVRETMSWLNFGVVHFGLAPNSFQLQSIPALSPSQIRLNRDPSQLNGLVDGRIWPAALSVRLPPSDQFM